MLNQIVAGGNLTANPETRFLQSINASVTRFTIAVGRDYKAQNEEKPKTDFINCVAWNKTGEFVEKNFSKGSKIIVAGRLETDNYTDNETGKKVYTTTVKVEHAYFGGDKRENGSSPVSESGEGFMNIPDGIDEELPFN